MMTTGIQKKFQTDICDYMNIQYHMNCAHTHAHIWIIHYHTTNTLDLSDISEYEDLMTTSSDEDIPALDEDIEY